MRNKTNKSQKWAGAGIVTAIAASACCITPVLAIVAGVGGIASSLSWLEPLRPFFIGITVFVLGFAWYQQLKPKKEIDCDCDDNEKPSFWQSKKFLTIATVLAILLLAFPYYAPVLIADNTSSAAYATSENFQQVDLNIEGMTCAGCEATINQAVSTVPGVVKVTSDYKTGQAVVKIDSSKASLDSIVAVINRSGYRVVGEKNIKLPILDNN
ncbi:MAG: mercuric transport protein MerTP [Calditrichaeota bacterium]|nr:mercuric transport protein MerTP [Calditrichota bacterium]